ncbi:hypothetical protein VAE308_1010033 [Vibrio aestuarianus]|nr:hypothetical protein VAE308_1010033 [Vibrio aestuarianus]
MGIHYAKCSIDTTAYMSTIVTQGRMGSSILSKNICHSQSISVT